MVAWEINPGKCKVLRETSFHLASPSSLFLAAALDFFLSFSCYSVLPRLMVGMTCVAELLVPL